MTERTPPERAVRATLTGRARLDGLDGRSMRARTEPMDVALVGIGRYAITTRTGGEYTVDVLERGCTCPDWTEHEPRGGCKHMRRVNLEILAARVPRPDGRLPTPVIPDGGKPTSERRQGAATTDEGDGSDVEGPFWERDPYGGYTGVTYYRCRRCGTEALRRKDLIAGECCVRHHRIDRPR